MSSRGLPLQTPQQCRAELRTALPALRARCLHQAATWAAELLVSLPQAAGASPDPDAQRHSAGGAEAPLPPAPSPSPSAPPSASPLGGGAPEGAPESDRVVLGRLYLDGKEYRRAAHVLQNEPGPLAFFLRNYALLLAGEKRKEEEALELSTLQPAKAQQPSNGELPRLVQVLEGEERAGRLDAFGLFLFGMVLVKREQKDLAIDMLCRSLTLFPCNWSAWTELQAQCTDVATLESVRARLPPHWARTFWGAAAAIELHRNAESLERCADLARLFPRAAHLVLLGATAKYHLRDFEAAELMFEELLRADPYRIEGLDTYSNILYVKEKFGALSHLAHQMVLVDKYRAETCCVIGNYLSLKGRHERAVVYFRRALKLRRTYLSAWTLMGHEYVEMKNTPAAIEAYRNAVDICPTDYRAWYGLGQTYEILALPYYALYYYRKATQLRPHDARMWCALGQCYESEQMSGGGVGSSGGGGGGGGGGGAAQLAIHRAIRCYEKAYQYNDSDGIALQKLAKLHEALGRTQTASFYYRKNLERLDAEQRGGPETAEALLFLGNFHRGAGDLNLAEQYCARLLDFSGPAKEEAKALLRDIRSMNAQERQVRQAGAALGTPQGVPPRDLTGAHKGGAALEEEDEEDDDELEDDAAMDLGDTP